MAADDRSTNFKDLLLYFAENISGSDFINMKFRYEGKISRYRLERITHPTQLFSELQSRSIIGIDKIDELKMLVENCMDNNQDFADRIDQFEKELKSKTVTQHRKDETELHDAEVPEESVDQPSSEATPSRDLQKETELLTNELGENWKSFFRHIDIPESEICSKADENSNDSKKAISSCLYSWLCDVPSFVSDEVIRKAWITALEGLNRNELAHQLESIKNNQ